MLLFLSCMQSALHHRALVLLCNKSLFSPLTTKWLDTTSLLTWSHRHHQSFQSWKMFCLQQIIKMKENYLLFKNKVFELWYSEVCKSLLCVAIKPAWSWNYRLENEALMMRVWELSQEHYRDRVARLCPKVRIPVCLCNKLDVSSQHNIDTLGNNSVALVATFRMACTLHLNNLCRFNKAGAHLIKHGTCKVIRIQACRSPINRILPLFKIVHCLLWFWIPAETTYFSFLNLVHIIYE